jgi:2-iminobutanoate/2-iminopropanoate deaminase
MSQKQAFTTKRGPAAKGPYSTCVAAGDLVFVSGQVPIDPATGHFVKGGIEDETRQVLENLQTVLGELGLSLDHVVKTTIFLRDMGDFARVNEVYGRYFTSAPPARSTVQVARLPFDVGIEIEAVALR